MKRIERMINLIKDKEQGGKVREIEESQFTHRRGMIPLIRRIAGATLAAAAFAMFTGVIASGFRGANAQDIQIAAAVGSGSLQISTSNSAPCTTYDASSDVLTINNVAGRISSGCVTLSAWTDGIDGYTLTIDGPNDGNLTAGGNQLTAKNGTLSNPSNFPVQAGNGQWGFAIPQGQIKGFTTAEVNFDASYPILASNNSTNTSRFAAVPTTATPFSRTEAANVVGNSDVYNIHFAIATSTGALSGTYSGAVTISGVVNAPPEPPVITAPTSGQIFAAGTNNTTLTATTLTNVNCYYGTTTNPTTLMSTTGGTTHSQQITGLVNSSTNTYYIRCQAPSGQGNYSGDAGVTFYVRAATPTGTPTFSPASGATDVAIGATTPSVSLASATCKWGASSGNYSNASGSGSYTVVTGSNTLYYSCTASSGSTESAALTGQWSFTGKNPILYMQSITSDNCPTARTMAVDARDNNTYWIRKIPGTKAGGGDLCWMETNLAYAGGTSNGGVSNHNDIRTMTLGNGATSGNTCYNDYNNACYYTPTGANPTSGATSPSTEDSGTGQYGYLYNWCAAMGGTSVASNPACNNTSTSGFNTAISVCPAGWRLPTGTSTTGEFTLLNNTEFPRKVRKPCNKSVCESRRFLFTPGGSDNL